MSTKRKKISLYAKQVTYAKCNGKCKICGKPVKFKKATIDHILPISQGGTDDVKNYQIACLRCNRMKNNMTPDEMLDEIWRVFWHNASGILLRQARRLSLR